VRRGINRAQWSHLADETKMMVKIAEAHRISGLKYWKK
jgi:hypothetical protein